MRKLTAHIHPGLPESLQIGVQFSGDTDQYEPVSVNGMNIPALVFQEGPIQLPRHVNGWTNEALIAVLVDRINRLNVGDYRCRENSCAITHLEEALHWLHARTTARQQRGVEGTKQE